MKLKKYHVHDIQEGLEQIRRELGNDAVIVETRKVNTGRKAGMLEIVAGVENTKAGGIGREPLLPDSAGPSAALSVGSTGGARFGETSREEVEAMMGVMTELRHQLLSLKSEVRSLREQMSQEKAETRPAKSALNLRERMQMALHRLDESQTSDSAGRIVAAFYQKLIIQGVVPEHIEDLLAYALGGEEEWSSEPQLARKLLRQEIARRLVVTDPLWVTSRSQTEVAVLVGPSGVGKTTTLAKIAAHAQVAGRKRVAIICADPFRVGGPYQIRTYAELMKIPSENVSTVEEFRRALDRFAGRDLILVDTTGQRGGEEAPRGPSLERLKAAAPANMDLRFHLCLSASTRTSDLLATTDRMSYLPIESLIFTKIDETDALGGLVSTVMHSGYPLSVLGSGPEVPADILSPTAQEMASWMQWESTPTSSGIVP